MKAQQVEWMNMQCTRKSWEKHLSAEIVISGPYKPTPALSTPCCYGHSVIMDRGYCKVPWEIITVDLLENLLWTYYSVNRLHDLGFTRASQLTVKATVMSSLAGQASLTWNTKRSLLTSYGATCTADISFHPSIPILSFNFSKWRVQNRLF